GLGFAVKLNLLLLLCYFAHLVGLVVGLMTIGLLWLLGFERARWRAWLLHPLLLLPQVALPLWYVFTHPGTPVPNNWSPLFRWIYLREMMVIFHPDHFRFGPWLGLLFALLVVATLVRERHAFELARQGF